MKTLQECKDEVARKHASLLGAMIPEELAKYWDEVAKLFAQEACREQREICAAHYRESCDQEAEYSPSLESGIKNAPEPKMI